METDSLSVRLRKDRLRPRFDVSRTPLGERIGSWRKNRPIYLPSDPNKAYDWIINLNRVFLERFGVSMEDFKKLMKKKGNGGNLGNGEGSFEGRIGRSRVPVHMPLIPRPQDVYNILVNNKNEPFQHVWLEKSEDGTRVVHPLEKLSVLDFAARSLSRIVPIKPPPVENFPFKLVEEVKDLKELAAKLKVVDEFAVDLEHNQYRSFQGLTCLMQISTRAEDFVIDTLKLRIHVGPYLRESFKDPYKRKVMHGADCDILWLQRDFGIYVCNLFDTGQASRVMQLEKNSLEYLLLYFCGVNASKEYQKSDWRLRPIPGEMLKYAREDTHYLLYIYDLIRSRLLSSSDGNGENLLIEVYKRSYATCMQLYEKELLTDSSYIYIYGLQEANFNSQQFAIVSGLYKWRDAVARAEDESTGYILPNKVLLEIARQMPPSPGKLRHLLKSKWPFIERDLNTVSSIINHSIRSASAFEGVVEVLKKGRQDVAYNQYIRAVRCSSVYIPAEHLVSTFLPKDVHNAQIVHDEENAAASASGNSNHVKPANEEHFNSQIQGERSQLLPLPKIGRFFMPSITAETTEDMKTDDDSTKSSQSACTYMFQGSSVAMAETSESSVTSPFHSFAGERRLSESHRAEVPMQSHTGTLQACNRPSQDSELQEDASHNGVEHSSHPGKIK